MQQAQQRAYGCAYGHMVHGGLRESLYMYLRVAVRACGDVVASALRLRHRCVSTAVKSAWHEYLDTWLRGMPRACVCPCVRACCVFECERSDGKL